MSRHDGFMAKYIVTRYIRLYRRDNTLEHYAILVRATGHHVVGGNGDNDAERIAAGRRRECCHVNGALLLPAYIYYGWRYTIISAMATIVITTSSRLASVDDAGYEERWLAGIPALSPPHDIRIVIDNTVTTLYQHSDTSMLG